MMYLRAMGPFCFVLFLQIYGNCRCPTSDVVPSNYHIQLMKPKIGKNQAKQPELQESERRWKKECSDQFFFLVKLYTSLAWKV